MKLPPASCILLLPPPIMGQPVFLFGLAHEAGAMQGDLQQRVLESCAPHWIEESQVLSDAADIELWQLLALNCLPPNFWNGSYQPPPLLRIMVCKYVLRRRCETQ